MLHHLVGEQRQADTVALPGGEMCQAGGQQCGITPFRFGSLPHGHRTRDVDDQVQINIGLGIVLFDVEPVVAGVQLPVQMTQIITRDVLAMAGKVDRKPHIRAAVLSMLEPLDNAAGEQFEIVDRGEWPGRGQFLQGDRRGGPHFVRTCAITRRMTSSVSMPSARA